MIMYSKNILDKGNITLLNVANAIPRSYQPFDASDADPAIVARQCFASFGEERAVELDLRLVKHLEANKHTSCLEMTEFWFSMKLPLFVADQFKRHRSAILLENEEAQQFLSSETSMYNDPTINQTSARYVPLEAEWYIPEVVGGKAISAKQGQEDNLSAHTQKTFKILLDTTCKDSYGKYIDSINSGIAPEHARLFLHTNHYTSWVWKQDLHNLFHFMMLRTDAHAQLEARVYAEAMYGLISEVLPETMKIFDAHRRLDIERSKVTEAELILLRRIREGTV